MKNKILAVLKITVISYPAKKFQRYTILVVPLFLEYLMSRYADAAEGKCLG